MPNPQTDPTRATYTAPPLPAGTVDGYQIVGDYPTAGGADAYVFHTLADAVAAWRATAAMFPRWADRHAADPDAVAVRYGVFVDPETLPDDTPRPWPQMVTPWHDFALAELPDALRRDAATHAAAALRHAADPHGGAWPHACAKLARDFAALADTVAAETAARRAQLH